MNPSKSLVPVFAFYLFLALPAGAEPTRHPVVLAQGILASRGIASMKRMANALRAVGDEVSISEVSAIGSVELRAEQLRDRIDEILAATGASEVNVIAHSMGGLDARYLISKLGYAPKVASLTTLSTPHRGSPVADRFYKEASEGHHTGLVKLLNFIAPLYNHSTHWGDSSILDGLFDLTTEQAKNFNREVPDADSVYYQSYAASAWHADQPRGIHKVLRKGHALILALEGPNDGMVSLPSARWGNFRGTVEADHFSMAGYGPKNVTPMRIEPFIQAVTSDLAERGY